MAKYVSNERVRRFAERVDPSSLAYIAFGANRFLPWNAEAAISRGPDEAGGELTVRRLPSDNPPPLSPYRYEINKVERDPERIRLLVEALRRAVYHASAAGYDPPFGEWFEFVDRAGATRSLKVLDQTLELELGPEVMALLQRYVEPPADLADAL